MEEKFDNVGWSAESILPKSGGGDSEEVVGDAVGEYDQAHHGDYFDAFPAVFE